MNIRHMTIADLSQVLAIDQVSFSLPWPERSFRFEITDNPAPVDEAALAGILQRAYAGDRP